MLVKQAILSVEVEAVFVKMRTQDDTTLSVMCYDVSARRFAQARL